MSDDEKDFLIKKLANALAFISDLREGAINRIDPFLIRKTAGINEEIAVVKKKFPKVFLKYYNNAKQKASKRIGIMNGTEKNLLEEAAPSPIKRTTRNKKTEKETIKETVKKDE